MRDSDIKAVHYTRPNLATACGADYAEPKAAPHEYVTCPKCRNSEIYIADVTEREIAFDGNFQAWLFAHIEALRGRR